VDAWFGGAADLGGDIRVNPWCVHHLCRHHGDATAAWHTFGEHDPAYTPLYAYGKHVLEGRRLRHRGNAAALHYQLRRLHESAHPAALTAEIAVGHGLFLDGEGDLLHPYSADRDFLRLVDFLGARGTRTSDATARAPRVAPFPKAAFRRGYTLGIALAGTRSADRFEQILIRLHDSRHPCAWLMRIGLCEGLFSDRYDAAALEAAWAKLRAFRQALPRASAVLRRFLGGA